MQFLFFFFGKLSLCRKVFSSESVCMYVRDGVLAENEDYLEDDDPRAGKRDF